MTALPSTAPETRPLPLPAEFAETTLLYVASRYDAVRLTRCPHKADNLRGEGWTVREYAAVDDTPMPRSLAWGAVALLAIPVLVLIGTAVRL